ncbi:exodeoxyribonuclease VII small subunit [Ectobacillus sp. JY-23]|uniref:exodeoxyribonuclease VII small subunit n=1 Tax=Ectobacillus sp. JY-23 TaxID=2933872 RepID=UPI001FF37A78|nr:exodeoxyribonuclease VII small subunit [Ectobacillus sp. JY-23]UOY93945.1 exodeoxyribonuclease VII small subunit [Ectobacillus sp. JY-23]
MKKQMNFEEAIAALEQIVLKLEQGDVPLEEAITYFKEGMELSKLCDDKLKHVEQQMTTILSEDGQLRPFQGEEA